MCSPQLFIAAAGQGLKFMQARQENRAAIRQANEQNRIAKENRIRKQTAEDYRILQIRKRELGKVAEVQKRGRIARAQALARAETISGVSVNRLVEDFFRQEGEYRSQVLNNLDAEVFAAQQNKEAYALNQEAQSKSIPHNNFLPTFAASATAFAGNYFDWKTDQEILNQSKKKASYYGWVEHKQVN